MINQYHSNKPVSFAYRAALLGILCALAVALSFLESLLPSLPIPGAKLGLSNVITMLSLSAMSFPSALCVTTVKVCFALLRGGTAFLMSAAGGFASVLLMAVVWRCCRSFSMIGVGLLGALTHNTAQMAVAMLLVSPSLIWYAPWLILTAAVTGTVTGLTVKAVRPVFLRLSHL